MFYLDIILKKTEYIYIGVIWRERNFMNRYEKIIIESFEKRQEQTISELFNNTHIPKRTLNRYLDNLISKGELKAIGKGRGRYYQRIIKPKINQIALFKSGELVGFLGYEKGRYVFKYVLFLKTFDPPN